MERFEIGRLSFHFSSLQKIEQNFSEPKHPELKSNEQERASECLCTVDVLRVNQSFVESDERVS